MTRSKPIERGGNSRRMVRRVAQWSALWLLAWLPAACLPFGGNSSDLPRNAAPVTVVVHTAVAPWLTQAAEQFNARREKTADGATAFVQIAVREAGLAAVEIADGRLTPDLWVPDEPVWTELAQRGSWDCVPLAQSPLVIAMWREAAEALGWPGRSLGWLDIGSLAADPTAWQYYSGGQFGETLRLGHTHPGLSGSGMSTLLALVQAAESKTAERVTVEDVQRPIVQASVGAFEGAVAWFSADTAGLAQAMVERGPGYLGAAVMYENLAATVGQGRLAAIYPFEGTFVATNPGCLPATAAVTTAAAARLFRDWLLGADGQALAQAAGLRPATGAPTSGPLTAANGADVAEPAVRFPAPTAGIVLAVQDLWQAARKPVHLTMLLDVSGSMRGEKMESMRRSAEQFVQQMGDADRLTLVTFSTFPGAVAEFVEVGPQRAALVERIRGLVARGDTALYDAIAMGAQLLTTYASPQYANALVVLTDGQDTSSFQFALNDELFRRVNATGATVFTIAYGRDADARVMERLALGANGKFFLGNEASIGEIYEEMSAAFGGSAGIGR